MSYSERPRQPLAPAFSSRTLHHPSFLPLCMAARFRLHNHRLQRHTQTVHPIIPAEVFYTDPTMSCRRRVPNIVTNLRVLDCFQLNTPPPVMSACVAPPNHPDPFQSGPHPTQNLGSPVWRIHRVQPSHIILQLTQEEDQAITNLLKLHHQYPLQSSEIFDSAQTNFSSVAEPPQDFNPSLFCQTAADGAFPEEANKPLCCDGGWSDKELEAADILLNCFILKEGDTIRGQSHLKSAGAPPDPRPCGHPEDSSVSTEALPALLTSDFAHISNAMFCGAMEEREPCWSDVMSTEDELLLVEMRGRTLTDSERVALHVLLSLGNMGTLGMVQQM
ncbi:hypothetical protein Q5P01_002648 [Channa striata]|uniref:Uncharacterized protein n=1 Tax=Channa striata TaxID=64152 RepID=A0AA88NRE8_CHASR|nr:hypothetical protein Q5P01_002648 [Channa striata]